MNADHERAGTAYDSGAAAHELVGRCAAPIPQRIQLRRTKGWRMPPNTVKVDRTTRWGNDFIMAHEGTRLLAVAQHRQQAIAQNEACPKYYEPLRGKNLACWCPLDKPCHADVLLELANQPTPPLRGKEDV